MSSFKFGGIQRLYGDDTLNKISSTKFCIVGIGGVGGWCAEALVRSGATKLTLIDLDDVCYSNVNRQVHALDSTVGKFKVDVMKQRLLDINSEIEVETRTSFVTRKNADKYDFSSYDIVIDCIDTLRDKVFIAQMCIENKVKLIVSGSAGGQKDPTLIHTSNLLKTRNDNLLRNLKKALRKHYDKTDSDFEQIQAIYSMEKPILLGICTDKAINCNTGYGTSTMVIGSFGFNCAKKAIDLVLE